MQLANASDPRNQFTRREYGGRVRPGLDYIVGERRPEVFSPDVPGHVYPSVNHYEAARERVAARLRAQAGASAREAATAAAPAGKSSQGQGSGVPASLAAAIQGTLARVADALEPFETAKAGDVVQRGLKEKPRAADPEKPEPRLSIYSTLGGRRQRHRRDADLLRRQQREGQARPRAGEKREGQRRADP